MLVELIDGMGGGTGNRCMETSFSQPKANSATTLDPSLAERNRPADVTSSFLAAL
jgi:hypothetical protein